jgi:hypothetical protein
MEPTRNPNQESWSLFGALSSTAQGALSLGAQALHAARHPGETADRFIAAAGRTVEALEEAFDPALRANSTCEVFEGFLKTGNLPTVQGAGAFKLAQIIINGLQYDLRNQGQREQAQRMLEAPGVKAVRLVSVYIQGQEEMEVNRSTFQVGEGPAVSHPGSRDGEEAEDSPSPGPAGVLGAVLPPPPGPGMPAAFPQPAGARVDGEPFGEAREQEVGVGIFGGEAAPEEAPLTAPRHSPLTIGRGGQGSHAPMPGGPMMTMTPILPAQEAPRREPEILVGGHRFYSQDESSIAFGIPRENLAVWKNHVSLGLVGQISPEMTRENISQIIFSFLETIHHWQEHLRSSPGDDSKLRELASAIAAHIRFILENVSPAPLYISLNNDHMRIITTFEGREDKQFLTQDGAFERFVDSLPAELQYANRRAIDGTAWFMAAPQGQRAEHLYRHTNVCTTPKDFPVKSVSAGQSIQEFKITQGKQAVWMQHIGAATHVTRVSKGADERDLKELVTYLLENSSYYRECQEAGREIGDMPLLHEAIVRRIMLVVENVHPEPVAVVLLGDEIRIITTFAGRNGKEFLTKDGAHDRYLQGLPEAYWYANRCDGTMWFQFPPSGLQEENFFRNTPIKLRPEAKPAAAVERSTDVGAAVPLLRELARSPRGPVGVGGPAPVSLLRMGEGLRGPARPPIMPPRYALEIGGQRMLLPPGYTVDSLEVLPTQEVRDKPLSKAPAHPAVSPSHSASPLLSPPRATTPLSERVVDLLTPSKVEEKALKKSGSTFKSAWGAAYDLKKGWDKGLLLVRLAAWVGTVALGFIPLIGLWATCRVIDCLGQRKKVTDVTEEVGLKKPKSKGSLSASNKKKVS